MGRVAQVLKSKTIIIAALVVVIGAGAGIGVYEQDQSGHVKTVTNSQHQLTRISYSGKNGVNAFSLLQKYAKVQSKHYSFGEFVTSINGEAGNGPKYWTLYVNGKQATVGASAYITKNSDTVTWKLQ